MSRPNRPSRIPSAPGVSIRPTRSSTRLSSLTVAKEGTKPTTARRASVSGLANTGPGAQRTSKTSQKLVVLPSAPQTKPLYVDDEGELTLGYETDTGVREYKSKAERMTKEQRKHEGYKRITAYCISQGLNMKLLASFLKREHNVSPRIFDEAVYAMYYLPLLPGYGPNSNFRSSIPAVSNTGKSVFARLSEAEEDGYQGTYFTSPRTRSSNSLQERDGYISSSSPVLTKNPPSSTPVTSIPTDEVERLVPSDIEQFTSQSETETEARWEPIHRSLPVNQRPSEEEVAEVVFFEYGVVVFFGLPEGQERGIIEDIDNANILQRRIDEDDWEIEECHYTHDPHVAYPRIYNDFFTLKSRSHLLKLSIAHALAQSTLLARYESNAQRVLSSPVTLSIPKQLASSGALQMRRHEALKLTGRLFKLRRDVNLVSNVLDVPELFWSEASLKELYDAVREYMEIKPRAQVLNEKLGVASDFLDAIHDHLNNSAMERITWIIIWLIVVAILVELGEVIARLIVHTTMEAGDGADALTDLIPRDEALRILDRMTHL